MPGAGFFAKYLPILFAQSGERRPAQALDSLHEIRLTDNLRRPLFSLRGESRGSSNWYYVTFTHAGRL